MELEEVQKQRSEDNLMGSIEKAFSSIASKMSGDPNDLPDGQSGLLKMITAMDENERADLFAQAEIESDIIQRTSIEAEPEKE